VEVQGSSKVPKSSKTKQVEGFEKFEDQEALSRGRRFEGLGCFLRIRREVQGDSKSRTSRRFEVQKQSRIPKGSKSRSASKSTRRQGWTYRRSRTVETVEALRRDKGQGWPGKYVDWQVARYRRKRVQEKQEYIYMREVLSLLASPKACQGHKAVPKAPKAPKPFRRLPKLTIEFHQCGSRLGKANQAPQAKSRSTTCDYESLPDVGLISES